MSPSRSPKRVAVLGSTGSIGVSTLDVIAALPDRLSCYGLAAHRRWELLFEQARRFRPAVVVLTDEAAAREADTRLLPPGIELWTGEDGLCRLAGDPAADVVVSAVVGAAGLVGTWEAVSAGKTVALANKETLVMAGDLVMERAAQRGAKIVPVDSEHSAIFQGLAGSNLGDVAKLILTASGGPFRGRSKSELRDVTPSDALRHPTWQMGRKITIDSATLMNKALEVIEARWLFDIPAERIEVVIHPESIVHSFVEYVDGSVMAQMSPPDMRLPIQLALTWPDRVHGPAKRLDWSALSRLQFETPDRSTFSSLDLGFEVARAGGTAGAVLNAANEAAVGRFLDGELKFLDIPRVCRDVLSNHELIARPALGELWAADRQARLEVMQWTNPKTTVPATL